MYNYLNQNMNDLSPKSTTFLYIESKRLNQHAKQHSSMSLEAVLVHNINDGNVSFRTRRTEEDERAADWLQTTMPGNRCYGDFRLLVSALCVRSNDVTLQAGRAKLSASITAALCRLINHHLRHRHRCCCDSNAAGPDAAATSVGSS